MYFNKTEVIEHRLVNAPRISYAYAAEFVRRINIALSAVTLTIVGLTVYFFLTEIHLEREAYFVKSTGEFKLIQYSNNTKEKAVNILYEKGVK
ncbi:hypothetical protein QTV49_000433 [Vibrio vulnificus]|nr:hypothetical protein [Vibrio vulnificus]